MGILSPSTCSAFGHRTRRNSLNCSGVILAQTQSHSKQPYWRGVPDVSLCCSLRHICLRRTFLSCCGDFHLSVLAALTLFYWVLLERVGVSCLDCQQGLGAQLSALSPGWGLYLVKQHHNVTCVWHRLKSLFDRLQCFIVLWMFEFFPFFKPACRVITCV